MAGLRLPSLGLKFNLCCPALTRDHRACPVCRRDGARPPRDDLRVPARELEDRRWPWRSVWRGWRRRSSPIPRVIGSGRGIGWRISARSCHQCFTARADALFELADAVLCADGPVKTLVGLSLAPEHRRGHGALYDAVNHGRIEITRLRWSLAVLPLPRWPDGRIRLGVDVSNWLRPDAATSPERMFCHCYGRGKGNAQMIPGWPYSVVAALEPGRTSWTAPLDAVRLGPADDETEVTAAQVREFVGRLAAAGRWRPGDEDILVVFDAGYDVTRLAWLLADLPVELCGRLRSDRVLCELPVIEGTLIQLTVDHLPGDRDPKPVWLCPRPPALIPLRWTAYGRRSCAGSTWNTPSACSTCVLRTASSSPYGFSNSPGWPGLTWIRRPLRLPCRTWTAASSPRWTLCKTVCLATPSAAAAWFRGSQPSGACPVTLARSASSSRMRQGAPGVSCSPAINPSASHR